MSRTREEWIEKMKREMYPGTRPEFIRERAEDEFRFQEKQRRTEESRKDHLDILWD